MPDINYNWTRFWVSRDSQLILDEAGYLQDPEADYGELTNSYAKPFASLQHIPCLVLLGEPGIGKSREISDTYSRIKDLASASGDHVLFKNLNEYGSEDRLTRELFDGDAFVAWLGGTGRLYLLLDSLDECLLRIDTIANILQHKLAELPIDRLYLRIACRTAVWSGGLEDAFTGLWGEDQIGVYELAPLRRRDVATAASQNGINPEQFLRTVDDQAIGTLAAKPVTLAFLLNTFRRDGAFPQNRTSLFKDGCRLLCEETSESRRTAGRTGSLDGDQRLLIASRIAAVTIFCNRAGVWTGRDIGNVPQEYVTVRDLSGRTEFENESEFSVTEAGVCEVLDSGLFTSRGQDRIGWAHQTYAEFLAAHYCAVHNMTHPQLMSLLVHPDDPCRGLIPQLSDVAGWVAAFTPKVFNHILGSSPEVLLSSDAGEMSDSAREALATAILNAVEAGRITDRFGLTFRRRILGHPGLAEQLRPYLADSSKPQSVREATVEMAAACALGELRDQLVTVALNPHEPNHLRVLAADAVTRIGDEGGILALKPILMGESEEDENDELKGAVLNVLWPWHLRTEELLALLTPPKQGFFGLYWFFLSSKLAQGLRVEDLPAALDWVVRESATGRDHQDSYEPAIDSIMAKAWEHLEALTVADAFARAAVARLIKKPEILGQRFGQRSAGCGLKDVGKRRMVIAAAVRQLSSKSPETIRWMLSRSSPLTLGEDLAWMAEQLRSADSVELLRTWAEFMRRAFQPDEPQHQEILFDSCQTFPAIKTAIGWLLIPLNSIHPRRKS